MPSFKISSHPTDLGVIWGMATSMLRDILHCHYDSVSMDFLLMFLTFKGICRKVDSTCVLLLAETKHLHGRNQARIHSVSNGPLENRINYPLPFLLFLKF